MVANAAALLPVVTYVLLVLIFANKGSALDAIVKSHIVVFAFIGVFTETLSAFRLIDFPHLLAIWGLFCLGCVLAVTIRKSWRIRFSFRETFREITPAAAFLLGAIVLILVATFATALLYPPNNWDSMVYHIARVPNWIVNRSVAFYATEIGRQNYSGPLAEFAILHLQLLSGSDLFANLVQWISFVVSIALGALITAELSLNQKGQLMSAVIIATIPMAILQSSSTQNDLVVTSFVLAFALFMLRLGKEFKIDNLFFASMSLGLALLTKGTAYPYCAAIGLALAAPILFNVRSNFALLIKRFAGLALVVLIALVLNIGFFFRSYKLYGVPIHGGPGWANEDLSAPALASNIPKILSLHFGTRSPRLNKMTRETLRLVLGNQLEKRDNNYLGIEFAINRYRRHEDYAGNPIHLWLTLLALPLVFARMRKEHTERIWYGLALIMAGCLYCLCKKWSPWESRLNTPLFALAAPVIVIGLTESSQWIRRYIAPGAIGLMVLSSLPFALHNEIRSLVSGEWKTKERTELYFNMRPELYEPYTKAMDVLQKAGARDVGFYIAGVDGWEYPFWVMAKNRALDMRFRHVGLTDQSKILQTNASLPEYIIVMMSTDAWPERSQYDVVYAADDVSVLKAK